MDPPSLGSEASREELPCLPPDIATTKASSTTPPRDEYDPLNDDEYNLSQRLNIPIPADDENEMRRQLNLTHDSPNMAASTGFSAGVEATAVKAVDEQPTHTIRTAPASTVLAEHDEYVRSLHADWDALPSEFPYKRSKRDKRKSRAKYVERKKKLKNPIWQASLEELDELAKKLRENQKQWSNPEVMMEKVMAKMKKDKKKQDKNWYEKMLAGPWKTSGPRKKLRRTIDGWEEVDFEDDEAEAMAERKQLRKRQIFPFNTWRWDELSSSDEAEARGRRVVAAAIKMLEKPVDSDDEDDEPIMHSLLSDDETIAADPPLRTKEEKAEEKAKKQEAELVAKEKMTREQLRPLLHPFFRSNKHSADHILHAGALPVEILKQSQFFPVSADVRKVKTALYKQKYEEKMSVEAKKDKVRRNRAAKKQRRFEARREKRSAYAHRLGVKGWDFPKEALTGYEDAIAKARIIPVVALENTRIAPSRYKKASFEAATFPLLAVENSEPENAEQQAPTQLLPTLPLALEYTHDPAWTFPVWDDEMAWTEYDTLPGRFETISKIIKDDDWNDQFVKGSKFDQELMRTIVVPVWKAMTYEEKTTVLGGQRVDPACFWSDLGDEDRSYVSGSPKMVDPFDIEGSDWVCWSHPTESDPDSIKLNMSAPNAEKASFSQGEVNEFDLVECTSCTDKESFDERAKNVSDFLESVMSSSGTEKASFDEDHIKESDSLQLARSSLSVEKSGFDDGEMNKSGFLKSAKSSASTEKASLGDGEMYEARAIVQPPTTSENSIKGSNESAKSSSSPEKASFEEGETNESDSWQSASFSSNIQRASFDQEEEDGSPDDPQTPAPSKASHASNAAFDDDAEMPNSGTLKTSLKEVNLPDFEEPLDDPDPDLDLNMLFQRVGALCQGEEACLSPFNSGSSREAELIYNLLQKEAVVCHWLPERTFSYDNIAWKTRVSIFDPENKDAVNPAVFPPFVKKVRNIEYSDPESMDLSIQGRNNVLQNERDIQMNWLAIADEYRLGLNGRQRLSKPEWAKNYDLIRAQQPDPLIYMLQDTLEFEEVGYFSEVLPKPLVFPEVKEGSYDNADWIWQKHCMDQRIGLHSRDQRSDRNATISDKSAIGLIGDNLPPDEQSFDTSKSFRGRRFSGDNQSIDTTRSISDKRSSSVPSFKLPVISDVPAEVGAQMLKELVEHEKPIPETEALGRPPPAKYIQSDDTPAGVFMRLYQEEYEEFRKECPEPTSIRFDREVYTERAPLSPEKKAKQDMYDYLAQMNEEDRLDFLKDVADCINKLVAPGPDDVFRPLEGLVETSEDFTPLLGSVRRKLGFKPKLEVDDLDMKHAREGIPILESVSVMQKACTLVAPLASDAGQSEMSRISESLCRRSERYSLRELVHEKPAMSPRPPSALDKAPSVASVVSSARSRNLNIALDASKARIVQKMKDRGESDEKQASMAATLDSFKHSEPAVPEPEPAPEHGSPVLPCNKETKKKEAQPAETTMTPAKARALIDYLIDDMPAMEEDELKEKIIHFFGERLFAYAMTRLDLSPVDVSEEEANAFLQQRFDAHRLIEEAEEAKAKEIEPATMSKREAQYLFQSTMTPAKARTLLEWAKRTQPHLYIKHMLAPGLVEYCETEIDAAPVAVTEGDGMKFLAWNMEMRESGQNLMELRPAARVDDRRTGKDKSEFDASPLISVAKGRAMVEWLVRNRPDLEVMKLLSRKDLGRITGSKNVSPVQVTENEAVAFFNILSKRAMEIRHAQRDQGAQRGAGDETFPLFEEETLTSNILESSLVFHGVEDPEDGSKFGDTCENDPKMSHELAAQLTAWVLDVRPDCNPTCVLGEHFIRYVSQYQGPKLGPLEDDEAFLIFKKYALAQQVRTGRTNVLDEGSEHKPSKEDGAYTDVPSHHLGSQESVLEKFLDIESAVLSRSSGSESSELKKFPDIGVNSPSKPEKTSDAVRLRLKPSQVHEFLEYLKSMHGHCDFKNQSFERMIKAYIQLPDSAPTKDFPIRGEGLDLFKQMVMTQLIAQRKRQRAFDQGRVAYAYGAGTDPDIRRERGEKVEDDVEEDAYNPYDDMYDGIAKLFGSLSSIPRFDSPGGSIGGSFRCSFGSSFGGSSTNEWLDLPSEVSGSVKRRENRGLFIRKRLSHTFDPIPDDPSNDNGRLHLRRNPSSCSQHEADRNEERSCFPLMSAFPGGLGLGLSLLEHEQNENDPQSPTPAPRIGANRPLRAAASERSSSPVPSSEDSDSPRRTLLEGRVSQRPSASETFPSRARAETLPPASFASWPSEDSYQNSTDWSTDSSASMTFSQYQAMRQNYKLEKANMSGSFPAHGHNPFDEDVDAENARRDDEGDDISDLEAYEAWYNAKLGVSPEELEEGRRYFQEEQMIDEMEGDPEMLEKVLGVLDKIDVKVAEAHAQAVEEARKEEEKETALRGGVTRIVDDDPAHLFLHAPDPKKEFKKTLLQVIEHDHLDAEEIEMLLEKIDERDEPSEYQWVHGSDEQLEESDWADESDEEDDIDQDYHVQEHQERMQLNFEQCEYEGALARVEAWRDAHEEHADPDFPQREREADEARKAEDKKIEAIVKAWEASKALLTVPHRKRGRRLKAKALRKKEKGSLGNAQNFQGPFSSEPEALPKKEEAPLLKDQTSQGSVRSRRAPESVSSQVTVENEALGAEQRDMVAETLIPPEEELFGLKSVESGGHESKNADLCVPSPTPTLRSAPDDASNEALSRRKNLAAHLGFKSKDMDVIAPSPTPSIRSGSAGVSGVPFRKLAKTRKPSAEVAGPFTPSLETFSPRPSKAPGETAPGLPSLVQRMPSGNASIELPSTKKSIKARIGLTRKDLNTGVPSPTPSSRSVSHDFPRRTTKKLIKKRKPGADDTLPSTPSRDIFSPSPSMAPSESAPRSTSLGQRATSIFKRKDKEEVDENEESGSSMMKRMKSLKFKKRKD